MITAVNKATGQGLEVVGPANRLGAGLRPHGSSATPISVPAATAAIRTNERTIARSYRPLSPFPLFFYSFTSARPTSEPTASTRADALWEYRVVEAT